MSIKPETRFVNMLHNNMQAIFTAKLGLPFDAHYHIEKMNNPYRRGTFDVWYSGFCGDMWIEYKWHPKIYSRAIEPGLTTMQKDWGKKQHNLARNVAVVVGIGKLGAVVMRYPVWEWDIEPETYRNNIVPIDDVIKWILTQTTDLWTPDKTDVVEQHLLLASGTGGSESAPYYSIHPVRRFGPYRHPKV